MPKFGGPKSTWVSTPENGEVAHTGSADRPQPNPGCNHSQWHNNGRAIHTTTTPGKLMLVTAWESGATGRQRRFDTTEMRWRLGATNGPRGQGCLGANPGSKQTRPGRSRESRQGLFLRPGGGLGHPPTLPRKWPKNAKIAKKIAPFSKKFSAEK